MLETGKFSLKTRFTFGFATVIGALDRGPKRDGGMRQKEVLTLPADAETMGHACCCGSRVPGR